MLIRKLNVLSVSDMIRNKAVFRSPSLSSSSSSYMVASRISWMSKGERRAPQEIRMDFAVLPETNCQGLLIKFTKSSHLTDFITKHTLDFVRHRLCCGLAEMDTHDIGGLVDGLAETRLCVSVCVLNCCCVH